MPKKQAHNPSNQNKAHPDTTIMLDRERRLRFDLNAMVMFEEETGESLFDPGFRIQAVLNSAKGIRSMLWACLQSDMNEKCAQLGSHMRQECGSPEHLTPQQVGAMISLDNMGRITVSLMKSFEVASPEPKESDRPLPETVSPTPSTG
jgi:hypothetical protein